MSKLLQHITPLFPLRRIVPAAVALLSLSPLMTPRASSQSCTTTITGKVYSPLGPTAGDPIPNILVYVATTPVAPFTTAGPGPSCSAQSDSVSGSPLVSTTTNAAGVFTLNSTGLAALGTSVNVVIQAGKWRRQNQVTITPCGTTTVNLTMPANQSQGDLPHIAVVTGEADGVECIFRRIGISDSEFTDPGAGGSINLYEGAAIAGASTPAGGAVVNPTDSHVPAEADLVESPTALSGYDLIMFGCQGTSGDSIANNNTNGALNNLVNYANSGGRIFATHYGYVWLDSIQPFESSATWLTKEPYSSNLNKDGSVTVVPATINPNYAQSATLSQWLQNVGASYNNVQGQVGLTYVRVDTSAVNNPPAQSWVNLNNSTAATGAYPGNPSMQFTFDTPINTSTAPSVSLTFTNTPSTFLQGDPADKITINVTDSSATTAADASLNLSLTVPAGVTATSLVGANANTGWVCSVGTLTCSRTTALAAGTTDAVLLGVSIAANAPLGNANVPVTISGGGLSNNLQCGRVLYNDYHVETGASFGEKYPTECVGTALSAQEKFLEYSLYNLSNFVAPVTTDIIDIVATPLITWPAPAAIYYGTPLGATQLNATATLAGAAVPGTFAYTPPSGTILPVGVDPLSVVFTPTDLTSYTTATANNSITVLQDGTTISLSSSVNPSTLGQSVTFTALVNATAPTSSASGFLPGNPLGTVSFFSNGVLLGTGTYSSTPGNASIFTFTTTSLPIGSNQITATYGGNADFGGSSSATLVQLVQGVSTTTITGLVSPIDFGQIIGNTASIVVAGSSTGGTATVYINNVNVCVLQVSPGMTTSCPASTGAGYPIGTYSIYAVFSGDALYLGSTSPTYTVQIVPDPTTTTLTSSLNPSRLGNSVTFTATVAAPYATPTGNVTFLDGATTLGVGQLNASGVAAYSTTALTVGTHNIMATYAATTDFSASAALNTLAQVVLPPLPLGGAPGYILTVTPTTVTAPVGAATPVTVTIQEVNGYSEPIALACTGLTNEATCTFQPAVVPAGGGTATLFLTPAAPHACGSNTPYFVASNASRGIAEAGITLASLFLLLGFTTRRRRKLLQAALLLLALCAMPMLNGCGTVGCTDLGTKPGTYSFTVQAAPTAGPSGQYEGTQSQTVTYNATL